MQASSGGIQSFEPATLSVFTSLRGMDRHHLPRSPRRAAAYGSSQSTSASQSQSQNTSSTSNTSTTSISLSPAASAPRKRVRIDVNGVQAVPGADSTATTEAETEDATEVDEEGTDTDAPKKKKGRGKVLSDAEFQARVKERNRLAAANARRAQRNELTNAKSKVALLEKDVDALKARLGSLQRYVYDLEAALHAHDIVLPPRSPTMVASRSLAPTDSFGTDATEVTTSRSSPEPEPQEPPPKASKPPPRKRGRPRKVSTPPESAGDSATLKSQPEPPKAAQSSAPPASTSPRAIGRTRRVPTPAASHAAVALLPPIPTDAELFAAPTPSSSAPTRQPPRTPERLGTDRALRSSPARAPVYGTSASRYTSSPRYNGPEPPMSYVRDTEAYTPASVASHATHTSHTSRASHASTSAVGGFPLQPLESLQSIPLQQPGLQQLPLQSLQNEPLPPTPATLEALQLQLKIQEFLASQTAPFLPFSFESTPASTEFTGGDDYDTMSLSAFFNLDSLDDDPNDANFEPTSPKPDSSDDESDFEEEERPARKRARTEDRNATPVDEDEDDEDEDAAVPIDDEEEEDLFLPIEDVPVPPPRPSVDDLYAEAMESLGVSNRQEFTAVVTKLFTDANGRGGVTPQQMETLKRLMRIIEAAGIGAGPSKE